MARKTLGELINPWSALRELGIDFSPEEQARGIAGSVNDIAGLFGYDPGLTPEGVQKFRSEAPSRPLDDVVRDVANGAIGEVKEHPFATVGNVVMGAPRTALGLLRAAPKAIQGGAVAANPLIQAIAKHPQAAAILGTLGYRMLPDGSPAPAESGGNPEAWKEDFGNTAKAIGSITEPIEQMVGANGDMSERAQLTNEHLTNGNYSKAAKGTAARANDAYSKVLQQSYLAEHPEIQGKIMELMARRGGDSKTRLSLEKEFRTTFNKMLPLLKTDRGLQEEYGLSDKNPGDLARGLQKMLEGQMGIEMPDLAAEIASPQAKAGAAAAGEDDSSTGLKLLGGTGLGIAAYLLFKKNPAAVKKLLSMGGKAAPGAEAAAPKGLAEMIAASKGKGTKMASDVFEGYKGAAPRAYMGKAVDKATVLKQGRDARYDQIFDKALAAEEKTKATIQAQMDRLSEMMGQQSKLKNKGIAKGSKVTSFGSNSSAASVSGGAKSGKQALRDGYKAQKRIEETKRLRGSALSPYEDEIAQFLPPDLLAKMFSGK